MSQVPRFYALSLTLSVYIYVSKIFIYSFVTKVVYYIIFYVLCFDMSFRVFCVFGDCKIKYINNFKRITLNMTADFKSVIKLIGFKLALKMNVQTWRT